MKINRCLILFLVASACRLSAETTNLSSTIPRLPEPLSRATLKKIAAMTPILDGKTLDGWVQSPVNYNLSGSDLLNPASLARELSEKADPVSTFLYGQLDDAAKGSLENIASGDEAKAATSALAKNLNRLIAGPSIFEEKRFANIQLRSETQALCKTASNGSQLSQLNRMLLEDAYPSELVRSQKTSWVVKDGAIASTGAGRGVVYTAKDYSNYRIIFNIRHVSGKPDHQPCVLFFCSRPAPGEKGLDALGGIQFQVPNGGHWDYRPGFNKGGNGFTIPVKTKYDNHEWSQVEILVNAKNGTARMAVAQSVGTRGVENLDYNNAEAGKTGPFALQMHNGGLFDEYKDIRIELDPTDDKLITTE